MAAAPIRPVIVAPFIGKFLREHQREGVRFMFECVNGLRPVPTPRHALAQLEQES